MSYQQHFSGESLEEETELRYLKRLLGVRLPNFKILPATSAGDIHAIINQEIISLCAPGTRRDKYFSLLFGNHAFKCKFDELLKKVEGIKVSSLEGRACKTFAVAIITLYSQENNGFLFLLWLRAFIQFLDNKFKFRENTVRGQSPRHLSAEECSGMQEAPFYYSQEIEKIVRTLKRIDRFCSHFLPTMEIGGAMMEAYKETNATWDESQKKFIPDSTIWFGTRAHRDETPWFTHQEETSKEFLFHCWDSMACVSKPVKLLTQYAQTHLAEYLCLWGFLCTSGIPPALRARACEQNLAILTGSTLGKK